MHIHEMSLTIIYQDYNTSFEELLRKDISLTIHQRKLKLLVSEMFQVNTGCAPDIMKEIFEILNRNYIFRQDLLIKRHITALKQLLVLTQKYETLYLIAAKMQPH